jgi:hypothetical protein
MRQFEDRLRLELRRVDPAPSVTKEAMLARVARARRRRAVAAGAGALVASGLTLTLLAPVLGGPMSEVTADPPRLIHEGRMLNVVFTDATHGYALQERCSLLQPDDVADVHPGETPEVQPDCEAKLLVTEDAGASWQARAVPAEPARKDAGVELVSGHSMMLWVPAPGTLAMGTRDRRYWTTTDAGLTWHESSTPYPVPDGYGLLGADDRHTFLVGEPPGIGAKNPVVPASDGSFWMRCLEGPCVRVTRDQGATWQPLPVGSAGGTADWVATADGRTVFAGIGSGLTSTPYRSTDGGLTWSAAPDLVMPFRAASAVAMPSGDVILQRADEAGGLYRLTAGMLALKLLADAPARSDALYRTGSWLVAATALKQRETPDLGDLGHVSPDNGDTWIAVPRS